MFNRLRTYFISGLVIFLPLALTVYLLNLTIKVADGLLGQFIQPYFSREFGFYFRGLSILICLLLIFLIGFVTTNFLGKKIVLHLEKFLLNVPFFRQIYPAIKELAVFLFARDKRMGFQKVVLLEFPRKGVYSIGFLTNDASVKIHEKVPGVELCNVFVPKAPSPLNGYLIMIPKNELMFPDITIEAALKFIISGGVVNPP